MNDEMTEHEKDKQRLKDYYKEMIEGLKSEARKKDNSILHYQQEHKRLIDDIIQRLIDKDKHITDLSETIQQVYRRLHETQDKLKEEISKNEKQS